MIFALTGIGITILSTLEMEETFTQFPFSSYSMSFLTDDIIRLRYVEIGGQLRKILTIIKMRGGAHTISVAVHHGGRAQPLRRLPILRPESCFRLCVEAVQL